MAVTFSTLFLQELGPEGKEPLASEVNKSHDSSQFASYHTTEAKPELESKSPIILT